MASKGYLSLAVGTFYNAIPPYNATSSTIVRCWLLSLVKQHDEFGLGSSTENSGFATHKLWDVLCTRRFRGGSAAALASGHGVNFGTDNEVHRQPAAFSLRMVALNTYTSMHQRKRGMGRQPHR